MPYNDIGPLHIPEQYIEYVICKSNPTDKYKYWTGGSWAVRANSSNVITYNLNTGIAQCFKMKNDDVYSDTKLVKLTTTIEDVKVDIKS